MKRLTSWIIAFAMAITVFGGPAAVLADDSEEWNKFSKDSGVEYVLECCNIFQKTIGDDETALRSTMNPEDYYGP